MAKRRKLTAAERALNASRRRYGYKGLPGIGVGTISPLPVAADETAQFMVIEFDRNDKRILLSHTRLWEQVKEEEKQAEMKEKKAEFEETKKAVKNIQSKVEKATLGDLGVLAGLKAKMDSDTPASDAGETPAADAPAAE
jgi:hypothetical protein